MLDINAPSRRGIDYKTRRVLSRPRASVEKFSGVVDAQSWSVGEQLQNVSLIRKWLFTAQVCYDFKYHKRG